MCLVHEQAAWPHCSYNLRETFPLQIEESDDQVKPRLRSLKVGEIINHKLDVGYVTCRILPRFFDRYFGDVNQRDTPAALREIDCVASRSACKVERDPRRYEYTDIAIAPVDAETETLELFTATAGGVAAVEKKRRQDAIFAATPAREPAPVKRAVGA